jgi:hypothetical protein
MNLYDIAASKPVSEVEDVEECLLTRTTDLDGVSNWDWVNMIMTDDVPHQLIEYIVEHKDAPLIAPLYDIVRESISSILNKD